MSYSVIAWDNNGQRSVSECATLDGALALAKQFRCKDYRNVAVVHCEDLIRHWTRTTGAHGNQWSARATAESHANNKKDHVP